MSTLLSEIIYCSRATTTNADPIEHKIAKIVAVGRLNNERDQITGALLFAGGYFAQVIQGPGKVLEELFARICTDRRHHDVKLLSRSTTPARTFPEWAMGLIATKEEEAAATALLARAFVNCDEALADEVRTLLQQSVARSVIWG